MRLQRLALSALTGAVVVSGTVLAVPHSALAVSAAPQANRCHGANLSSFGAGASTIGGVAVGPHCTVWAVGGGGHSPFRVLIYRWSGHAWRHVPGPKLKFASLAGVTARSAASTWAVGARYNGRADQTLILRLTKSGWRAVASPDPAGRNKGSALSAVTIDGRQTFAVGSYQSGPYPDSKALIVRWNGRRWHPVPSPSITHSVLTTLSSVALASATVGWAVGESDTGTSPQALIEHWNGKRWSIAPAPVLSGLLQGITALSGKNAWAVGYTESTSGNAALIEHWNGKKWTAVPDPNMNVYSGVTGSYLTDVAAISPTDVMATGYVAVGSVSLPVVLRWNGVHWTVAKTQNPAPAGSVTNLTAIAGTAATGFWITGDYLHGSAIHSFALHRS